MWLLGAGASAAAGIPTAGDMIAEFKQQLYVSQRRVDPRGVADLSNPAVRTLLQTFIDSLGKFPEAWAPDEYAALFEAAYPSENDRRVYLDGKLSGGKPSYGHIALATLMKADRARIVWTTNFDPLVADACAKVFDSTGALTTVALDAPTLGRDALNRQRWPLEIKLHGDFRSRRLKNTDDELRQQDAHLRDLLRDACGRHGLIVAGYSGRDDSIMDALEAALDQPEPFPGGLFWLHRGDGPPFARVDALLRNAADKGVDGGLVQIENFDETLRDLIRLISDIETLVLDQFGHSRRIWSPAPAVTGRDGFPVIRLNGLELTNLPSVCRRIECGIGGYRAVTDAIAHSGKRIIAARTKVGVLAFGSDADCRAVFGPFDIRTFDVHTIEQRRLRYESNERGLLRRALSEALARAHGLTLHRRRNADQLAPTQPESDPWVALSELTGRASGTVRGVPDLTWREGVSVRLDWAADRPWLLVEPRILFDGMNDQNRAAAVDFARERTVRRYNADLNALLAFWAKTLANGGAEMHALGISAGLDAAFTLGRDTAFSRRVRA